MSKMVIIADDSKTARLVTKRCIRLKVILVVRNIQQLTLNEIS